MMPTLDHEIELRRQGYLTIAGVDEAGRGCWAGPVVAAAAVLGPDALEQPELLRGVDDSKRLSAAQRERALAVIRQHAQVGVGTVPAFLIDCFGIVEATRLAMELAVLQLPVQPDALLIDALRLPRCPLPQRPLVYGDSLSLSIAAASIVAKTARDAMMRAWDRTYPEWRFGEHKGYGTAVHARALRSYGSTPLHRRSFRPLWPVEKGNR
jgi:ribonuclease HII